MILHVFRRRARPDTISSLYGTIVAQARTPDFYLDYEVADTLNGRFELLVLHLGLALDRLDTDPALRALGQGLFERFCRDMDDNLREIGIGDLSVPKEMRRIADAFYGRFRAYRAALAGADALRLAETLSRNVYGRPLTDKAAPRRLAAYIQQAQHELHAQEATALAAGDVRFPNPSNVSAA